jgi:hypothetical protein
MLPIFGWEISSTEKVVLLALLVFCLFITHVISYFLGRNKGIYLAESQLYRCRWFTLEELGVDVSFAQHPTKKELGDDELKDFFSDQLKRAGWGTEKFNLEEFKKILFSIGEYVDVIVSKST